MLAGKQHLARDHISIQGPSLAVETWLAQSETTPFQLDGQPHTLH
ncbi:MAG: hypothetical protein RLZZ515_1976 [Cyanobacteriota bacterium]|jgi:hypothetical protein